MLTNITAESLKSLRNEINAALLEVAQRHGIKINAGNAKFTASNAVFKLDIAVQEGNGSGTFETAERTCFKANAHYYGLKPTDLDQVIELRFVKYKITGLLPKSRRFPIAVTRVSDGAKFKLPAEDVKMAVARLAVAA